MTGTCFPMVLPRLRVRAIDLDDDAARTDAHAHGVGGDARTGGEGGGDLSLTRERVVGDASRGDERYERRVLHKRSRSRGTRG